MEMVRTLQRLHFNESEPDTWAAFEKGWEIYWRQISNERHYSDFQKVAILQGCISPQLKEEIEHLTLKRRRADFGAIWTELQSRYGPMKTIGARKKMVRPENEK